MIESASSGSSWHRTPSWASIGALEVVEIDETMDEGVVASSVEVICRDLLLAGVVGPPGGGRTCRPSGETRCSCLVVVSIVGGSYEVGLDNEPRNDGYLKDALEV